MEERVVQQPISPLIAAAHDLKTPLVLIRGISSTLLDEGNLLEDQRESIERIMLSSGRSLRVVESLVDTYRVEQTQFSFPLEPINIRHVVDEVAHELSPFSKKLNRQITPLFAQRRISLVVANKVLFTNALYNLVDNALKHGTTGDVVLDARQHHDLTRLSVRNDGPPLSQAEFDRLEERLGGHAQPMRAMAGTSGIGLYIVKQLVNAMGGKLGLERRKVGMSIYIDLHTSTQLSFL
jgi:signal transduction histidine kinase